MSRILGLLAALLGYLAVGTLISLGLMAYWLVSQGRLTWQRWEQIQQLALGYDVARVAVDPSERARQTAVEQPSLEEIAAARALQFRQLELREQQLREGLDRWRLERLRLEEDRTALVRLRESFQQELQAIKDNPDTEGEQSVRAVLSKSRPRDAQRLLMEMIQRGEMDRVVDLVAQMPVAVQAKIIAEFKGEAVQHADEILRRIRDGKPVGPLVEKTENQLAPSGTSAAAVPPATRQ